MPLLKNLFYNAIGYGRRRSQRIFEKMYSQALYGMNYASPAFEDNGEIAAMRYVKQRLTAHNIAAPILFDVGANVGEYALALNATFQGATIHCFEPGMGARAELEQKTAGNPHIMPHDFGLGETPAVVPLFADSPMSKTASLYDLPAEHVWKGQAAETVEIRTLDDFCAATGITRIHLLKIDVEGHELPVLKGAGQMLQSGQIDFIQFEFGFRQIDSRSYFRDFYMLLNSRYRISRIVKDGLVPLDRYHEGLEVFVLVSNYLAEIRR